LNDSGTYGFQEHWFYSVFTLDLGSSRFTGIGFSGLLIGFSQDLWIWFLFGYWCSCESINLNYYKHIVKILTLQANKRSIYKFQKLPMQ